MNEEIEFFVAADRLLPRPACKPALIDPDRQMIYRVAFGPVGDIFNVQVGGIPWTRVERDPGPGGWAPNCAEGTFALGGITLAGEVRCDFS